ncbi:hypothetical protein ABS768_06820 [Flavobacterium sp. ST-75]|uniref:TonB C-terminal domain-containing protein n=1 Tax=Flavobacterium rhizophilum TaxID=3163296 RepID=A0ABW8YAH0_9FLAO
MKKFLLILSIMFIKNISIAQNIKIGEDGEYAKTLIEWSVSKQNRLNPLKKLDKPYWTTDVKYDNGTLIKITLCKLNQPITGLTISTDFCEYCIIKNGKINTITKEFNSLTLESVKDFYIRNYSFEIIDNLYFTDDFNYYYKFILSKDNTAIVEYHKTKNSSLSKSILQKIEIIKKKSMEAHTKEVIKNIMHEERNTADTSFEIKKMRTEISKNNFEIADDIKQDSIQNSIPIKRNCITKPQPRYICNEEGTVIVKVTINKAGKVIEAIPGINGTTNMAECLLEQSKIAALHTVYEPNNHAPEQQTEFIYYNFKLTD